MAKKAEVLIKHLELECRLSRNYLVDANETADGIVFNFKNGLYLYVTDTNMPISTKQLIRTSVQNIRDGLLIIDLTNYQVPARAEF
jgi:hypothetical protein